MINQITVFLENTEGRLAALTQTMARAHINMKALSIAENAEYGVVRVICDNPDFALEALDASGYRACKTPVCAVVINDCAGGLATLMELFDEMDVNVAYGYCFSEGVRAIAVMKISASQDVALAQKITAAGFTILQQSDLA